MAFVETMSYFKCTKNYRVNGMANFLIGLLLIITVMGCENIQRIKQQSKVIANLSIVSGEVIAAEEQNNSDLMIAVLEKDEHTYRVKVQKPIGENNRYQFYLPPMPITLKLIMTQIKMDNGDRKSCLLCMSMTKVCGSQF